MDTSAFVIVLSLGAAVAGTLLCGLGWYKTLGQLQHLQKLQAARDNDPAVAGTLADLTVQMERLADRVEHLAEEQDFLSRAITTPQLPPKPGGSASAR